MPGTYAQESKGDEERTGFLISDSESTVCQFGQDPSSAVTSNKRVQLTMRSICCNEIPVGLRLPTR